MASKRLRGPAAGEGSLLQWTEKYAPSRRQDLLVRKNKVQEFVEWMESVSPPASPVCVVSGSSGCGKSTLIRVVAAECGLDAVEYVAKVQQRRSQYARVAGGTDMYESKLEAYESFCARAWMPTLDSHRVGQGQRKNNTVVVLDDVPTVVGAEQEQRLVNATLGLIARSAKVVLVVTEISSKDAAEHHATGGAWESSSIPKALTVALTRMCNPAIVSLNPIPKATMVKHLQGIAEREGVAMSKGDLQVMAEHSQGDLRSAILGLQFAARGISGVSGAGVGRGGARRPRRGASGLQKKGPPR